MPDGSTDDNVDEENFEEKLRRVVYADTDSVIDLENCASNCFEETESNQKDYAFQVSEDLFDTELV